MIAVGCEAHYLALLNRINVVAGDKWPEALLDWTAPFIWAREHAPELARQYDALEKEANELWLNRQVAEFKKISTEWGTAVLQIIKQYAAYLRQREAA